jgi:hypothetical protein
MLLLLPPAPLPPSLLPLQAREDVVPAIHQTSSYACRAALLRSWLLQAHDELIALPVCLEVTNVFTVHLHSKPTTWTATR